jgi:hypothetical protein
VKASASARASIAFSINVATDQTTAAAAPSLAAGAVAKAVEEAVAAAGTSLATLTSKDAALLTETVTAFTSTSN